MRNSAADTKVSAEGCGTPWDHAKTRKTQTREEKPTLQTSPTSQKNPKPQTPQNCVLDDECSP